MGLFRRRRRDASRIEAQIEALQAELIALRKGAHSLAESASKAASKAIGVAEAAYDGMETWTADNANSVRGSVRDQPLTALLVSLGAGAVLGAFLLRR